MVTKWVCIHRLSHKTVKVHDRDRRDSTNTSPEYPPGCYLFDLFLSGGGCLYVFGGGSTGSCSSSKKCICKSTSPCTDGGAFAKNGTLIDDEYM